MNSISTLSLFLLGGACLYAALNHLFIALRRPVDRTHLLTLGMCLAVAGLGLSLAQGYQVHNLASYVTWLKWNISFAFMGVALFPWFIAEYTGVRPRAWLTSSTVLLAGFFLINLIRPYSLQYNEIQSLESLRLPWGEVITHAVGRNSLLFMFAAVLVLANICFGLYALTIAWRHSHMRTTLAMLFAVALFLGTGAEGILVRASVIDFIHLGPYGFIIMIIVFSVALSHDTQQRLQISEQRFRSLVEQSPFSIQVLSPDGWTRQVNPAWEKLWGLSAETLGNYNVLEDQQLIDKGAMPYIKQGFAGTPTEIPPIVYNPADNPVLGGPARDRWVRAYIYPIKNRANAIRDVIVMHEDVTDKKRVEDAIHLIAVGVSSVTDEKFFQQLVLYVAKVFNADYAFIGMLDRHDPQQINTLAVCTHGQITSNLSYSPANTPCSTIISQRPCIYPRDVQRLFPKDQLLIKMDAEGYIGTPLFDTQGIPLGLIVVLDSKPLENVEQAMEILEIFAARASAELERKRATEERESLQQQFLQAQKMESVGRLAAGVAHDFNNFLSPIIGYSDLALMDIDPHDPKLEYFEVISNAGKRAAMVARQLLAFSRKQVMELTPLNLSEVVTDILKILRKMLGEDISVTEDLAATATTMADLAQIEQTIMNLAVNARDAMPGGGNISIATADVYLDNSQTEKPGNYTMLAVTDTGEGMPAGVVEKIFEPFFTTKGRSKGTGLGLAMVDGVVKQHNGFIHVFSKPGKGTSFKIYLPVTSAVAKKMDKKEHASLPRGRESILVVDDEPTIRQLSVDILEPLGYTCISATSGEDALEIIDSYPNSIDLLLTDVIMPGMSGKDLSNILKEKYPSIKTLFMSGYNEEIIAHHGVLDSGVEYLAKPLTPMNLAVKLHEVLEKS